MSYDWNPQKAKANQIKHGIQFADAVSVFEDDFAVTVPDDFSDEDRYITLGQDAIGRVLVVVYTYRGLVIRIISARKANRYECRLYQGEL